MKHERDASLSCVDIKSFSNSTIWVYVFVPLWSNEINKRKCDDSSQWAAFTSVNNNKSEIWYLLIFYILNLHLHLFTVEITSVASFTCGTQNRTDDVGWAGTQSSDLKFLKDTELFLFVIQKCLIIKLVNQALIKSIVCFSAQEALWEEALNMRETLHWL